MTNDERARASAPVTATPLKVTGLGAPIAVRISFRASEIPALSDAIDDEIARYASLPQSGQGAIRSEGAVDPTDWSDQVGELRRMRTHIPSAVTDVDGSFEVLWFTYLAHHVVHRAVDHAQRRADSAAARARVAAHEALAAAKRTRRDFETVDMGSLDPDCLLGPDWL